MIEKQRAPSAPPLTSDHRAFSTAPTASAMATISQLSQTFPPKSLVHESDLKDLVGQVAIVTGGYAGIGYETARVLLQHNAKVYIAGRSVEKGDKAIAALEALTGKKAEFLLLDLGSIKASKAAAEELAR